MMRWDEGMKGFVVAKEDEKNELGRRSGRRPVLSGKAG